MTLSQIIREVAELSLPGKAIQSDVKGWTNRAQQIIARRHPWTFLHDIIEIVLPANQFSVDLPANFWRLASETSPISYIDPTTQPSSPIPVKVRSRAELERMSPAFNSLITGSPSGYGTPAYVFLERNDGQWTLNTLPGYPITTGVTFRLSCFLLPEDLSAGADSSPITDDPELGESLLNWVRSKAYAAADPTDARAGAAMALYEQGVRTAIGQDARNRIAGRAIHF